MLLLWRAWLRSDELFTLYPGKIPLASTSICLLLGTCHVPLLVDPAYASAVPTPPPPPILTLVPVSLSSITIPVPENSMPKTLAASSPAVSQPGRDSKCPDPPREEASPLVYVRPPVCGDFGSCHGESFHSSRGRSSALHDIIPPGLPALELYGRHYQ